MDGELTWTSTSETPVLLFLDETLKPGESTSRFSPEDELEIEDVPVAQQSCGDSRGVAVDLEDGEDESVCDVSLKEPSVLVFAAVIAVLVAEKPTMPVNSKFNGMRNVYLFRGCSRWVFLIHQQASYDLEGLT